MTTRKQNSWPAGVVKRRAKLNDGVRWYIYAWKGGPQLATFDAALPERAPAWLWRSYEDLRAAQRKLPTDTIMGLIRLYKKSPGYRKLRPESLRWTNRHLNAIEEEFGDVTFAMAECKDFIVDIEMWRDSMADRPAAADAHVRMLRTLLGWGVRRQSLACNRAIAVERVHPDPDYSDQLWTDEELARFKAAAKPHLANALEFARLTGLRQGDLCRITWTADKGDLLEWDTSKSNGRRRAYVPVTAPLRAFLDRLPRTAVTIMTGARGLPMKPSRLRDEFAELRGCLGIDKRWHDLRGNAATELLTASVGGEMLSDREISVILGVSERNVSRWRKRYVADRAIARGVVERLSDHRQKRAKHV